MSQKARVTYGLHTAGDLYAKLSRDASRLESEVTSDAFFDFAVTACHLPEWMQSDPSSPGRNRLAMIRRDPNYIVCREIANASKHFRVRGSAVASVESEQGFGIGRFGHGGHGLGEEAIMLELTGGTSLDALEFIRSLLELFAPSFALHSS